MNHYKISEQLLANLIQYLNGKPYAEVGEAIPALRSLELIKPPETASGDTLG